MKSTHKPGLKKSQQIPFLILAADLLWVAVALYLAYECRYGFLLNGTTVWNCFSLFGEIWVAATLIWIFLTLVMKPDGFMGGWNFRAVFSDLFVGVVLFMVLLLANGYLARLYVSRLVFIYFGLFIFTGFLAVRGLTRWALGLKGFRRSVQRIVILGGGRIARELATTIMRHPEMSWQFVGFLCPDSDTNGLTQGTREVTQQVRTFDVSNFLAEQRVDEIILAMPNPTRQTLDLVAQCQRSGIHVLVVPQAYELYISRPELAELDGLPLIALTEYGLSRGSQTFRRLTDLVVAPLLLVMTFPVLFSAAVMLALRKGKAFRRELRCGQNGEPFWMYRLNVDRDVPALSAYERLFVELGITELPQLWNVLRGDMNFIGPRPEPPERVKHYSDWQRQRMKTKPGITGLAQIHGLRDQHSAEQKTHYDLQYILRWSPFLDLSLILQTVWTVIARMGKVFRRDTRLRHSPMPAEIETPLEEVAYVDHP